VETWPKRHQSRRSAHGRDFTRRDIRLNFDNPLCWRALIERLLEDSVMFPLLASFVTMLAAIVIALIPTALVLVGLGIFGAIRGYRRWMLTS
jgi:hypothetical protein